MSRQEAIKQWVTQERSWTEKVVRKRKVSVYDKSYSPKESALVALFVAAWATACFAPLGLLYHEASNMSGLVETFVIGLVGMVSLVPASFGGLLCLALAGKTMTWIRREFAGSDFCEECGMPTEHAHTLEYRIYHRGEDDDIGRFRGSSFEFCSTDCRESWERENREYDDPAWYRIQTDGDESEYDNLLTSEWYKEREFWENKVVLDE